MGVAFGRASYATIRTLRPRGDHLGESQTTVGLRRANLTGYVTLSRDLIWDTVLLNIHAVRLHALWPLRVLDNGVLDVVCVRHD